MAARISHPRVRTALLVPVATLSLLAAGCGAKPERPSAQNAQLQHFQSRPDLKPPKIVVARAAGRTAPGYIFLAPKKDGAPSGPLIVNNWGEVVWFYPVQPQQAADFRVQRYRGKPVLTWWQGTQPTIGIGSGKFVVMDDSYRRIADVRAGNGLSGDLHEFLITPRNTALIIAYQKVPHDLTALGGRKNGWIWDNVIQELDIATNRVLFEWRSIDHIPVTESAHRLPARTASQKAPFDYFHANSVSLDTDGNLLVSARNTSAVYKIRRRDGRVLWTLGGRNSDFTMRRGTRFAWQHDAQRQPDGTIRLFDNSAIPKVADKSRAIVLRVDTRAKTASLVRAFTHPRKLLAPHQGNAQRLANGDLLVGWGGAPYLTEYGRDGRVVFDARIAVGDSYRAYRFPWRGHPKDRPAIAARSGDGDAVTVYASWNGATGVAGWQVVAGNNPKRMQPVGSAPRRGFETVISVRTDARFVAVRALGRVGRPIGASRAVRPRD